LGAAVGARTKKTGQSRFFIGYKKHSLRLWHPKHSQGVLLIPLTSWIAPANRGEALFLAPSVIELLRRLDFAPSLIVADKAYINLATQKRLREQYQVGVLTRLPMNYALAEKLRPAVLLRCAQGQRLQWLGLHEQEQLHWFGVPANEETLCAKCWERQQCPREFSFAPAEHEIVLGTIPVNTTVAEKLLRQSRTWIEATQSYEKNQLGLASMFINSLHLAWVVGQLADTVMLLRADAYLGGQSERSLLEKLIPSQLSLGF